MPLSSPDPAASSPGPARAPAPPAWRAGPRRRLALWSLLIGLLVVAQIALLWLTRQYEHARASDAVETAAAEAATALRRGLLEDMQQLQRLTWPALAAPVEAGSYAYARSLVGDATVLMRDRKAVVHVEVRDAAGQVLVEQAAPARRGAFEAHARQRVRVEAEVACANARRQSVPSFSRSYFLPIGDGLGAEMIDLCLPLTRDDAPDAALVATFQLSEAMEQAIDARLLNRYEVSLNEADGARLARVGTRRGLGVFTAESLVDLPGITLPLRADSISGSPGWIPNLATALVLGLSLALAVVVGALARDVRRRAQAERGLAEALRFRKAMEDSLVTGLRARDLAGRITYVNPAFCAMVGYPSEALIGQVQPPYWPPESVAEYARRHAARQAGGALPRDGHETVFMRRNGERFPVRVFEAPLVDAEGRHNGWMSAVLDISEQRRVEELSRQQQEKLQSTARLATMGEMASLLSHELNQPLAAIASYAAGSLNLLGGADAPLPADADTAAALREAMQRMAQQAERAGRVIQGVHNFVRRRERQREGVGVDELVDGAMPLMRLAARRSGARFELDLGEPAPRVSCDRTMVEQVLLNLVRNAIQAMEAADPPVPHERRVVTLRARRAVGRWVAMSVIDQGPGIDAEVARRLFTPLFTTKAEGMGMGLSLCRTVIEQHGGALDHTSPLGPEGGTEFRFTLPAEQAAGSADASPAAAAPPARTESRSATDEALP
jgi:two-component system sensor histidine kinase DctS